LGLVEVVGEWDSMREEEEAHSQKQVVGELHMQVLRSQEEVRTFLNNIYVIISIHCLK
jgi:hypothetical protein